MRLIDADKLIILAENTFARANGFIQLIKETETAYDVEKVVAELENESDYEPIDYDWGDLSCSAEEHFIATDKATYIVRKGGVE
jgi:hypothetical protein